MTSDTLFKKTFTLLLLVLLPLAAVGQQAGSPTVLLIGIDGLRWDIIDRHPAPTLRGLAARGVRSQGLVPVMPSKTFPNFYAIATGLYPSGNGVLDNATYDPTLDVTFRMSQQDDPRWFQGEPIWLTAERQGVRAATMFWVGSAAELGGRRPSYWLPFDGSLPNEARVANVLEWFDLEREVRPQFVSLYFEAIDSASHDAGVDSAEEREAVAVVDASIATLLQGLEQRGLLDQTNILIVGDHGMTDLSVDRIIYVDDYVSIDKLYSPQLSGDNQGNAVFAALHGDQQEVERVYASLALAHPQMLVYRKPHFPDWFNLDHPDRAPDLVLVPHNGWMISKRGVPYNGPRASHGFAPYERDMHSGFIATGPAFHEGLVVETFEIIELYNLMAHLLQIQPSENEGNLINVRHFLK